MAVEFAIISTILFMVLFGIIEFGITYSKYEVFVNAAREGARRAAVRESNADVEAAVYNHAAPYVPSASPSIAVEGGLGGDPACSDTTVGFPVEVSWTQTFEINIAFVPAMTADVEIRGVFRCE